jgi:hypothetical protein
MDILQRLGIPLAIAAAALSTILAVITTMGWFSRKNHMPVEGRVCPNVQLSILSHLMSELANMPAD